jgi:hypothetical protein
LLLEDFTKVAKSEKSRKTSKESAMDYKRIIFSGHAIRQMFNRNLKKRDVLDVIRQGEVIINYPDDTPYPSYLILGFVRDVPVHVVFTFDEQQKTGIIQLLLSKMCPPKSAKTAVSIISAKK